MPPHDADGPVARGHPVRNGRQPVLRSTTPTLMHRAGASPKWPIAPAPTALVSRPDRLGGQVRARARGLARVGGRRDSREQVGSEGGVKSSCRPMSCFVTLTRPQQETLTRARLLTPLTPLHPLHMH